MGEQQITCPQCQQAVAVPAGTAGPFPCPTPGCAGVLRVPPTEPPLPPLPPAAGARLRELATRPPSVFPAVVPPPANSSQATTCLVLSGLGFVLCGVGVPLDLAALVLGVLVLRRPRDIYGQQAGRRQAIAGVALASAGLLWSVLAAVALGVLVPTMNQTRDAARRVSCCGNLKQIGLGLLMYSGDNKGAFPVELAMLDRKGILYHGKVYHCPSVTTQSSGYAGPGRASGYLPTDYDYYGTGLYDNVDNATTVIIAADHEHNHPGAWTAVLFVDGHVQAVPAATIAGVLALHPQWHLGTDVVRRLAQPPAAAPSSAALPAPP